MSLYVPASADLQAIRNLIKKEQVSSANVKSKWVREETGTALRNILHYLNGLKTIPEKGLILFASSSGVEVIDPPVPCRISVYKCGSEFYRKPLEAMYDCSRGTWNGMILLDSKEAVVAKFRGDNITVLWYEDYSGVPPKHDMGGSSKARFQRAREEAYKQWLRKVADKANQIFLEQGVVDILLAGPGFAKDSLEKDGHIDYRLKIIGTVSCEYTDDVAGPREALSRWKLSKDAEA